MSPTTRVMIEIPTDPADAAEPGEGVGEPEGLDEGLHFGRAWHRYRYCYRRADPLRVLVAGLGTGRSMTAAARLNPGASVVGIDASTGVVADARRRADGLDAAAALDVRVHDPAEPLPDEWGVFDFIVCRGVLASAEDPSRVVANLARALAPEGLLRVTVPSHAGRQVARSFRRAVETLAPPGAGGVERIEVGLELYNSLRPDHPIRTRVSRTGFDLTSAADARTLVAEWLADAHDWTLDGAVTMLARAGLRFLYVATPWRWRPDRVFAPDAHLDGLLARVGRLAPDDLGRLIDALDPTLLDDHYQIHACPVGFDPPAPDWTVTRADDPGRFERLIPELTRLVGPSGFVPSGTQGRVSYVTTSGTLGELDRWSHLLLGVVDGTRSCGEIERALASRARAGDDPAARQERWIDLADSGLILLNPHETAG